VDVRRLTVDELGGLVAEARAHEELSATAGVAAAIVAGTASEDETRALAAGVATLPCVLLAEPGAVADLAPIVDALPDETDLDAILANVERTPLAAVALALLVRGSDTRTIEAGLLAESTTYSMLQAGPEFATWRNGRQRRPRPTHDPVVLTERRGGTLTVTLNRPQVHNAFSSAMRDGLAEALMLAAIDPTIVEVVLTGVGPSFSSGGDLDEFGTFPDPVTSHLVRLTRSPARLLASVADRVVTHLHGACMGAGIELAAFGQRVVAEPNTQIALPELALGLVPGAGGTVSLPRRVGRHRTALLALTAQPIDATTALAWGLVDGIEPTEELIATSAAPRRRRPRSSGR
jgi:enoyl-CoA hydratase/carnithine racemase